MARQLFRKTIAVAAAAGGLALGIADGTIDPAYSHPVLALADGAGAPVAPAGTAAIRYLHGSTRLEMSVNGGAWTELGGGGGVPTSRQVIAGAGLTGGGDLTADRTFDVVAGDATIVVNANDIVVGVIGTTNLGANVVTNAKLRQGAATSVIGRSANSTGDVADIAASADGQFLRRASGVLAFGAITLADLPATVVDTSGLGANQIAVGTDANTLGSSNQATWDATTGVAVFTGPTATDATLTVRRPDATGGALYFGSSGHGIRRGSSAPGADNDITFYSAGFSAFRYYASGSEVAHVSYEGRVRAGDGSLAAPAFSFKDQTALGFYRDASMRMGVTGSMQFVTENSGLIVDAAGFRRVGLMKYGGREAGVWLATGQDFELGHVDISDLLGSISSFTVRWRVTDTEIQHNLQTKVRAATSNGATTLALRGYQTGTGTGTGTYIDLGYNDADSSVARIAGLFDGTGPALTFATGTSNAERMRITNDGNVLVGTNSNALDFRLNIARGSNSSGYERLLALVHGGSQTGDNVGLEMKPAGLTGFRIRAEAPGGQACVVAFDQNNGAGAYAESMRLSSARNLLVGTSTDVSGERMRVLGGRVYTDSTLTMGDSSATSTVSGAGQVWFRSNGIGAQVSENGGPWTYINISSATIGGSIASGQVAVGSATNAVAGSSDLTWSSNLLRAIKDDSGTNTQPTLLAIRHTSSGTPATDFGVAFDLEAEDTAGGTPPTQARILSAWNVATAASRRSRLEFWVQGSGATLVKGWEMGVESGQTVCQLFPNSSSTARPAYSFGSSRTSGFNTPTADTVSVVTAATEAARWTSSQNMLVGSTTETSGVRAQFTRATSGTVALLRAPWSSSADKAQLDLYLNGGGGGDSLTASIWANRSESESTPVNQELHLKAGTAEVLLTAGLTFEPVSDNTTMCGTASKRWSLVRGVTVTSGDLELGYADSDGEYVIREGRDGVYIEDKRTGRRGKFAIDWFDDATEYFPAKYNPRPRAAEGDQCHAN